MNKSVVVAIYVLVVCLAVALAGPPADLYKGGEDDGFDKSLALQPGTDLCLNRFKGSEEDGFDRNIITNVVPPWEGMMFSSF